MIGLARTNKAKFYLHSVSKEKLLCYIPPSLVSSCTLPSKMYIRVDNEVLYVCVPEKTQKDFTVKLVFDLITSSVPFPSERCVFFVGILAPPLPAVLNFSTASEEFNDVICFTGKMRG